MREDRWLKALERICRLVVGVGVFAWSLEVDDLRHWPILIPALWALGAPLELLIRFFTSGRLQIVVRPSKTDEEHERDGERKP